MNQNLLGINRRQMFGAGLIIAIGWLAMIAADTETSIITSETLLQTNLTGMKGEL